MDPRQQEQPLSGSQIYLFDHDGFRNGSDEMMMLMYDNDTNSTRPVLPPEMQFTMESVIFIIVYCICFLIASIGNLTVFMTLSRGRYLKSRISLIIWHLSIADLLVAFLTIPIEIGWRLTVQWIAGNIACKIMVCLRIFGMYLSNNILICVSLDRYFAVLHPLSVSDARRRGKKMLTAAWIFSIIYCIPQGMVYHVQEHEEFKNYTQCVTFEGFASHHWEVGYHIFCLVIMYFIPLIVICWVYMRIFCEISKKSKESNSAVVTKSNSNGTLESSTSTQGSRMRLRRSDMSKIERARIRALVMTIKIVLAFIFCWTPYIIMNIWYLIDEPSLDRHVNEIIQSSLFILAAIGNACANPLVYGSYAIDLKKECCHFSFLPCVTRKTSLSNSRMIQPNLGSKFQKSETKSPGVSKHIVHSVRQAVQGLFKAGSAQTKSSTVVEKLPLHTIKTFSKDKFPKSPRSEPYGKFLQESQLLDTSSDCQAIMEHQST